MDGDRGAPLPDVTAIPLDELLRLSRSDPAISAALDRVVREVLIAPGPPAPPGACPNC